MQAKKKVKVGDAISVYWPDDRVWYKGEVLSTDGALGTCEVLYEDGEREVLILTKETYKVHAGSRKRLFDKVLENDGDVSKQLAAIAAVLFDMEDRLPSKGVCSSRVGWWSAWHSGAESAVQAKSVILLAKSARELSCQLRPNVTTSWWNSNGPDWRERVRTVKTCAELTSFVTELLTKGVDWTRARQLFPTSNGRSDAGGRESGKDLRRQSRRKSTEPCSLEKDQLQPVKSSVIYEAVNLKTPKEGSRGRIKQATRVPTSQDRMEHINDDTCPDENEKFPGNNSSPEDNVKSKTDQKQHGREGRRKKIAKPLDEVQREEDGSGNTASLSTRSRRKVELEKEKTKESIFKEEMQLNRVCSQTGGGRAGKAAVSEQVRGGLTNRLRRNAKQDQLHKGDANDDDDADADDDDPSSQEITIADQDGQKGRKRGARIGKESVSEDESGAPSSRLRGNAKSISRSLQEKRVKRQRGNMKHGVSDREEEDLEEESGESGGYSSRSEDSEDGDAEYEQRTHKEENSARTRLSKRKSVETNNGLGKKTRREGIQTRCETHSRCGASGAAGLRKPSLKTQSDSDDDFVMEGSEESSSSSEDGNGRSNEASDGASDDTSSQEERKKSPSKSKGAGNAKTKLPLSPSPQSDEEVCSVCEFGGAADLMLLCDGENCEEAFHSFCLQLPLQSIPEGDWLCPLCLEEKQTTSKTSKKTSKMRAKLIPTLKKVEAIIGWRDDPPTVSSENKQDRKLQYLVKWTSLSHRHDTWIPEEWLAFVDRVRLFNYQRGKSFDGDGDDLADERRPEWVQIDRVIACRDKKSHAEAFPPVCAPGELKESRSNKLEYLVKWTNIEYNGSTWEEENNDQDMQEAIEKFTRRYAMAKEKACMKLTEKAVAPAIKQQPKYITGGTLHGYQLQGVKWLLSNFQQRKSVILADEMGLGKTIQAAGFIMALKHENLSNKPVLVIGPKSTLVGWEQELRQWGADLNSVIYQGEKESRALIRNYEFYTKEKNPLFDVLVTSYDLAMLDNSLLQKFQWSCIIVDEGHRVKNMRSKLGTLLKRQTTDFRLLLTGTPVQNTLTELFALLHFLDPKEFPDPEQSALEFAQVDVLGGAGSKDEGGMEQQVSRIHELLRPRMLRRLKSEVMQGMIPGKKYLEVMCALTPFQRHLYTGTLKRNHKLLNRGNNTGKKRSLNFILMDLKMVCNHPYLFPGKEPDHSDPDEAFKFLVSASGKLQLLEKLLPKLKEGGHRVLLFSQMTRMLDILEDFLSHLNFKFCRIDGTTYASERQKQIAEFNEGNSDIFIFLISTRAGGLGINLPSADTVIIYDPDFNPFVDLQAQARAHRIGQEKVVLVYQLITKCSVEEKILQRSRQKLAMENLVMSSGDKDTAEDVNTLLLHGARKVLEEHDVEATSVKWTDESLANLLNRDILDTKDVKEDGAGYLGAVHEPGGDLAGLPVDTSPNVKTGREWEELLGKYAEQDMEAEEGKLGRGKRHRKKIQYTFEPNIEAHGEEEDVPDAHEDDPSCSGGSAESGSDSDVSLDEERGAGSRGPYLTKAKSFKLEQEFNVPHTQTNPCPSVSTQGHPVAHNFNPAPYPHPIPHFSPHPQNVVESSNVIGPPLYGRPMNTSQPGGIQPLGSSPSWHVTPFIPANSGAVLSSVSSPSLGSPHLGASPRWTDPSHSPGTPQGSKPVTGKPFWEMPPPRKPGTPVSMPPSYKHPVQLSPTQPSKPTQPQVFGTCTSPAPYHSSVGHKAPDVSPLSHSNVDMKGKKVTSSVHQKTTCSTVTVGSSTSLKVDKTRVSPSVEMAVGSTKANVKTVPKAMYVPMPLSHSLPYVTNGAAPEVISPQPNLSNNPGVQGAFWQKPNEQSPTEFPSLQEVLRRTGSVLSGTNQVSTSGSPLNADISLEEVLRRTGSVSAGAKQVVSTGPSQLLQDTKNTSFEDVLRRTGTANMSIEEILQRSGTMVQGSKQALSLGDSSQILKDAKDFSLEEVLRRTGTDFKGSNQVWSSVSQVSQDAMEMSLEETLRRTGSILQGSKQARSSGLPLEVSKEDMSLEETLRRTGSVLKRSKPVVPSSPVEVSKGVPAAAAKKSSPKSSPKEPSTKLSLVPVKSETGAEDITDNSIRPTGPPASSTG